MFLMVVRTLRVVLLHHIYDRSNRNQWVWFKLNITWCIINLAHLCHIIIINYTFVLNIIEHRAHQSYNTLKIMGVAQDENIETNKHKNITSYEIQSKYYHICFKSTHETLANRMFSFLCLSRVTNMTFYLFYLSLTKVVNIFLGKKIMYCNMHVHLCHVRIQV